MNVYNTCVYNTISV